MKRSLLAMALALVVVLAGCGDDDATAGDDATASTGAEESDTGSDAGASTSDGDEADPTATAEPSEGSGSDPTPEATPEPTLEPASAALEAAKGVEGTYSGDWNNTTFGSTGPIDMEFEVDEEAAFALIRLDLGGSVFGAADPDPIVFEIDLAAEEWLGGGSELFGETDFMVGDDGGWVLHSSSVPGVGGLEMSMDATAVDGGYEGTYEIVGLADGTFTLTKN